METKIKFESMINQTLREGLPAVATNAARQAAVDAATKKGTSVAKNVIKGKFSSTSSSSSSNNMRTVTPTAPARDVNDDKEGDSTTRAIPTTHTSPETKNPNSETASHETSQNTNDKKSSSFRDRIKSGANETKSTAQGLAKVLYNQAD